MPSPNFKKYLDTAVDGLQKAYGYLDPVVRRAAGWTSRAVQQVYRAAKPHVVNGTVAAVNTTVKSARHLAVVADPYTPTRVEAARSAAVGLTAGVVIDEIAQGMAVL